MASRREKLASGYNYRQRAMDLVSIVVFFACEVWLILHLFSSVFIHPTLTMIASVVGYVLADFSSGFVHWLGDTWGSTSTFVLGNGFIRPFREHHVDQKAITRHDFLETNGSNSFVTLIFLLPAILFFPTALTPFFFFCYVVLVSVSLGVFGTNQFHKWAHEDRTSGLIAWLQRYHIILSPRHHAVHHHKPFNSYYCITVGWLNPILQHLHFFRGLERLIHACTGAIPRQEDLRFVEETRIESHR
jgi:ubiquitin-conjugating enzyme E2 variant